MFLSVFSKKDFVNHKIKADQLFEKENLKASSIYDLLNKITFSADDSSSYFEIRQFHLL